MQYSIDIFLAGVLFIIYHNLILPLPPLEILSLDKINKVLVELNTQLVGWKGTEFSIPFVNLIVFMALLFLSETLRKSIGVFIHKKLAFPISPTLIIKERLEELCERIDSNVSMGISTPPLTNKYFQLNLGGKRQKTYAPATAREIEQELIQILSLIQENKFHKLQAVIILDELDKTDPVSPASSANTPSKENLPEYEKSTTISIGGTTTQEKKSNVLSLIAHMKFFLSSAHAYFIFIAGRELYDGFLADVSDRDFTINSIFSGVINVDSFLVTSRSLNNISALSEEYICKHIMPSYEEYIKVSADQEGEHINSLKGYYIYHSKRIKNEIASDNSEQLNNQLKQLEINVHFLYKFSLYLAYVSNGSPNKIAYFFEKYIRSYDYLESTKIIEKNPDLPEEKYYLVFGFYSQQRINFIYYLTYPVLVAIINRSNTYGDKLLVSATFIVSHILKLYNSGFSWRNLEQTPELLENNRTPELREYIISIIDFLKSTHINDIHCGLYNYKFPMKISEEISYHSKMSDDISALFNFSQDETLKIKRYYIRQLEVHQDQSSKSGNPDEQYVLANMHHILGDTYMNEENYSKAIFEYHKSIAILKSFIPSLTEKDKLFHYHYLLHTLLKLGLANEKRHTDTSALLIYKQAISLLKEFNNETPVKTSLYKATTISKEINKENKTALFKEMRMTYQALLAQLYCLEKINPEGILPDDIVNTIKDFDALYIHAKKNDKNILEADFYRKLGDITYYKNFQESSRNNIECIHRDCYINKKNYYSPCNACHKYEKSLVTLLSKYKSNSELNLDLGLGDGILKSDFCFHFFSSLYNKDFRKTLLESNEEHLNQIAIALELRATTLFSCSNNHDIIDNAFLEIFFKVISESRKQPEMKKTIHNIENLKTFVVSKRYQDVKDKNKPESQKGEFQLHKVILYYWSAATCFNYAGDLNSAVRCYKQILLVFSSYIKIRKKNLPVEGGDISGFSRHIESIEKQIINRALISLYGHYENSNILEIQELKWRYDKEMYEKVSLNKLSLLPDIEEFMYPLYTLKASLGENINDMMVLYNSDFMGKYKSACGLSVTVQNLRLKANINRKLLLKILNKHDTIIDREIRIDFDSPNIIRQFYMNWFSLHAVDTISANTREILTQMGKDATRENQSDLIEFLLIDTLFCLTQILEIVVPLKTTTLFTNYFIAEIHEELLHMNYIAEFMYFFYAYFEENSTDIEKAKINSRLFEFQSGRQNDKVEEIYKDYMNQMLNDFINTKRVLVIKAVLPIKLKKQQISPKDVKKSFLNKELSDFLHTKFKQTENKKKDFYKKLNKQMKRSNINYTVSVYLAENAIRYYIKAKELHTEGKTYKNTIRHLYFLDDDLHNDTCRFLYARERYLLNSGVIEQRLTTLKRLYPESSLYHIQKYL